MQEADTALYWWACTACPDGHSQGWGSALSHSGHWQTLRQVSAPGQQEPHHSKPPQPGTAEKSTLLSTGGKQGHYVCLALQPPATAMERAHLTLRPPGTQCWAWAAFEHVRFLHASLGSHRWLKDWPFSHFSELLFMASQLSLWEAGRVRWWCPQPALPGCDSALTHHPLFSSRGEGCSHLGHGHLWPHSSAQIHCFPNLHFRGCRKQPSCHTVRTLYFQRILTTKRTEELQNALKI